MNLRMTSTLYLSVAKDGVISLWDNELSARSVPGETYVSLALSPVQVAALEAAQSLATANNRPSDEL